MPTNLSNLTPEQLKALAYSALTPERQQAFNRQVAQSATPFSSQSQTPVITSQRQPVQISTQPVIQEQIQLPTQLAKETPVSNLTGMLGTQEDLVDSAYKGLTTAYSPVDEASIRSNTIRQLQSQIDATNAYWDQQAARVQAERERARKGALGRATSIQARSGQLGSSFGEAQTESIEEANRQALESDLSLIEERRRQSVENLKGSGVKIALEEAQLRRNAAIEGAQAKINEIVNRSSRLASTANQAAKSAIALGEDLSTLGKSELDSIASSWGISTGQLLSAYKDEKAVADKAAIEQKKVESDIAKNEAAIAKDLLAKVPAAGPTGQISQEAKGWTDLIQKNLAKISDVPSNLRNQVAGALGTGSQASELQENALVSAKDLLDKFNAGNRTAVGKSSIFPTIPGTSARDFQVRFNNLKSLLSLDSVKYLKGQGQVSDAERRLLSEAAANIELAQSENEFKSNLENIVSILNKFTSPSKAISTPQIKTSAASILDKYGIK